jgi:hypothetical protein
MGNTKPRCVLRCEPTSKKDKSKNKNQLGWKWGSLCWTWFSIEIDATDLANEVYFIRLQNEAIRFIIAH